MFTLYLIPFYQKNSDANFRFILTDSDVWSLLYTQELENLLTIIIWGLRSKSVATGESELHAKPSVGVFPSLVL